MLRIVSRRARVSPGARRARHHADVRCALMADNAAGDCGRHRLVPGDVERWAREVTAAPGTDLEAAGVDVRRGVAPGAIAVEGADRDVISRCRDDGDVGERPD